MVIRALAIGDDRSRFRSGQPDLDRFFQRYAGQNQFRHHVGVTYVAEEAGAILGFVTVAAGHIDGDALPGASDLPRYPLPMLRLARLAVADTAQGRGVGAALVRFVFALAHDTAATIGCVGIVVDAKQDATPFYGRLGFVPLRVTAGELEDRPKATPMFIALGAVASKTSVVP